MKILTIITIFLLVSSAFCYPSKPLDERSTELTWQAWLLVDDQNQNKQNNEGGNMKKKVIAKSVFIVPTFNPEKLPPCAEGYASDSMGRCLEVFQVDTKNQLQFLLSKLQSHLESSHKTSTGPEKFTIEIPEDDSGNDDTSATLVLTQNPKFDEANTNNMVTSDGNSNMPKVKLENKNSGMNFYYRGGHGNYHLNPYDNYHRNRNNHRPSNDYRTSFYDSLKFWR